MEPATRAELEALRAEFQERHLNLLNDLETKVNQALALIHAQIQHQMVACEQAVFERKDKVHEEHVRFIDEALSATAQRLSATEKKQEALQLHLEEKHAEAQKHIEEKHAEVKKSMKDELLQTHKNSVNEVLEVAQARDGEIVEAFSRAKQMHDQTALKVEKTADKLSAYEAQHLKTWQQQQRQQPTEFDESTQMLGPSVSCTGGDLNETSGLTALVGEHCALLVDRVEKMERRLDAASSEHFAQLDGLQQLRQQQQQQQRSAPLEFDTSTRVFGPAVSRAGGDLNETSGLTALVEEHCVPLVDRVDKMERRLDAASSEHFAQLNGLRQLQQQQQQQPRSAPREFDESTRVVGPTVCSAGGGLSETRFTALFEEHCAPLVDRTDELERRLHAASSEHLAEVDAMRADHESLYHGMHHAKVEGLERAVHEFGKKSEFHDRAYDDLEKRLAAIGQPHTASAHLEGLLAGLENLAEKTQRQANDLMACKMKVASCDDHCALLDDHCVDQMEHANNATQKHDRLLGELMEHRERACLQEQGVQQELQRLKADLHSRDGFSGVDVAGVEARFEKRLEGLASNVSSQMKLSRDETDQVRLLLAGVQKAWGVTIRNPRQSRKSRHPYG